MLWQPAGSGILQGVAGSSSLRTRMALRRRYFGPHPPSYKFSCLQLACHPKDLPGLQQQLSWREATMGKSDAAIA